MTLPAGITGTLIKKNTGIKHIISFLGSDVPYHSTSRIVIFLKPVIKWVWRNANRVIALSEGLRETAQKTESNAGKKYDVIYGGIDVAPINKTKKLTLDSGSIRLISLGRLVKLKGFQDVIKAVHQLLTSKKIKDIQYLIIGEGPYRNKLGQLINELGLDDHVHLAGFAEKGDIQDYFSQSNIFIGPSHTEGFGLVFVEALACGLPVIGSNTGGIPEIVTSDVGLLVEPENVDDIANAIISLHDNYHRYDPEKMIEKASLFSWDNISDQYLRLYKQVIQS